jgi:uncharacterized membrane protein SirB2
MDYALVRTLHIACATLSIALFATRGGMQLAGWNWRRWHWLRWLPHVNDTLLLSAAVTLALISHQYPLQQPWLTAKVVALVVYVGLGSMALRAGASAPRQRLAYAASLATVAYIVGVAVTRSTSLGLF